MLQMRWLMYVSALSGLLRPARGKKASLGKYRITKGWYCEAPLRHDQRTGAGEREREKIPWLGSHFPACPQVGLLGEFGRVHGSHLLQLDQGLVVLALRPPQLGALQVELEALLVGAAYTGT